MELIHKFETEDKLTVSLIRESDGNYVIETRDFLGDLIEIYSRNIVKFNQVPTIEEFKSFWYDSIQTGRF